MGMIIVVFIAVPLLRIGRFQRPPAFGGADAESVLRPQRMRRRRKRDRFWRKTDVESTFWTQNRCRLGVDAFGKPSNDQKKLEQDQKEAGKTSRRPPSMREQGLPGSRMATKEDRQEDSKPLQLQHPQWGDPYGAPNGGDSYEFCATALTKFQ